MGYELCKHCDHFVYYDAYLGWHVHMEDGEQEFDHNAEPSGDHRSLERWKRERPDLFIKHEDGRIGPNSVHHSRRGKSK